MSDHKQYHSVNQIRKDFFQNTAQTNRTDKKKVFSRDYGAEIATNHMHMIEQKLK